VVKGSVLFLLVGGAVAACGWVIELIRGWRFERAVRRGENPDDF
jgi:hypothetical protein